MLLMVVVNKWNQLGDNDAMQSMKTSILTLASSKFLAGHLASHQKELNTV